MLRTVMIALVALTTSASAEGYTIVEAQTRDVLDMLAADHGQRIDVDRGVRGHVAGLTLSGTADDMFETLAEAADLDWFVFDGVGYASPQEAGTSRLIRLGDLSFERAQTALEEAGLSFDKYPVRAVNEGTGLVITGPPKLVGMTEALIESLPAELERPAQAAAVRLVRERRGASSLGLVPVNEAGFLVRSPMIMRRVPAAVSSETEEEHPNSGADG